MAKFQYLEKRDKDGMSLMFSADKFSVKIAEKCLEKIKNYKIYNELEKYLPKKYLESYYKRTFYESFRPTAHRYVINNWNIINKKCAIEEKIKVYNFPSKDLLNSIWDDELYPLVFKLSTEYIKNYLKHKIYKFYYFLKKKILSLKFLQKINKTFSEEKFDKKNMIAIGYAEGHDVNKRSDFYWLNNSEIDNSSVVVYFNSPEHLKKYEDSKKTLNNLRNKGVNWIKLWLWRSSVENKTIDNLNNLVKNFQPTDNIEKWMIEDLKYMILRLDFWISFFLFFNIKIHIEQTEKGKEVIIKQMALNDIGSCSIGKLRSYPCKLIGNLWGHYNNNIFFTWGEDSALRIKNTFNTLDNILISGFPYKIKNVKSHYESLEIKKQFQFKGVKTTLLLIDSNHSKNLNGNAQYLPTSILENFYKSFIKLVLDNPEIGIIIKSKRKRNINSLNNIQSILQDAINTGRCHLIEDTFQTISSSYIKAIDFAISTGFILSSAFMECAGFGIKSIYYDYSNISNQEKDIYSWGKNKVIFRDVGKIIKEITLYNKNPIQKDYLGNWDSHIDKINMFIDDNGYERIGRYLNFLQQGFNNNLDCKSAIKEANKNYIARWGKKSIFSGIIK